MSSAFALKLRTGHQPQPARVGFRAADALHLAVASESGATLYTIGQRLASAGPHLGVPTHLLA